jgi:hypothetical protein
MTLKPARNKADMSHVQAARVLSESRSALTHSHAVPLGGSRRAEHDYGAP